MYRSRQEHLEKYALLRLISSMCGRCVLDYVLVYVLALTG